jgi:hypothetical protein
MMLEVFHCFFGFESWATIGMKSSLDLDFWILLFC